MEALLDTALNAAWLKICEPRKLSTPDKTAGKSFSVVSSDQNSVEIMTNGDSKILIQRAAILAALRYLIQHQHNQNNPCEIRSDQNLEKAGELCKITSEKNSGTLVITYIVPMLASAGLANFSGDRPNKVWLV